MKKRESEGKHIEYGNTFVDKFLYHYFQYKFLNTFPVIVEAGELQYVQCTQQIIIYKTF